MLPLNTETNIICKDNLFERFNDQNAYFGIEPRDIHNALNHRNTQLQKNSNDNLFEKLVYFLFLTGNEL